MPTSLLLPSLSPTMEEGVLAKWLVKEGDFIKPGTMLCSVETDKTTVDYESLDEGFLRKIILPSGAAGKVNQLIGILTDEKEEDYSAFLEKALKKDESIKSGGAKPVAAAAASIPTPAPIAVAAQPVVAPVENSRIKASPLARKVAEESQVALNNITGSGPHGRIIRQDVDHYLAQPKAPVGAPAAGKGAAAPLSRPHYGSLAPVLPTTDIPMNMMRKVIAKRLLESTQSMPTFYVTMKIEMDALQELRGKLNKAPGYKVSVNDLVIKATAYALRQHPELNATFHGDYIRQYANIDICVAVSVDGGLITPIVRNVDQKGLGQISVDIKNLVEKAKANKLSPEEYQGGTFTISNMGMFGVDSFTAIINPPQVGILAVSGIQNELYKDGEAIKERSYMNVTLSADHRAVDGALGAKFLMGLKAILENPVSLML